MTKSTPFDWYNFFELANSFINSDDQAKQRTGISRFYYSAFCSSRDYINEKQIFLNEKSKKRMNLKKGIVHHETQKIFKKHAKFEKNKFGLKISKYLNKLRKMRNEADYDKITSQSLNKMFNDSKSRSKYILDLLKQLN